MRIEKYLVPKQGSASAMYATSNIYNPETMSRKTRNMYLYLYLYL